MPHVFPFDSVNEDVIENHFLSLHFENQDIGFHFNTRKCSGPIESLSGCKLPGLIASKKNENIHKQRSKQVRNLLIRFFCLN